MLSYKPLLACLIPFFLPFALKRLLNKFLEVYSNPAFNTIHHYILTEENFCKSAKEIRRTGFILAGQNEVWKKFINIFTMIWEYDNMYRYRFQDFFYELDKESFLINPQRELQRVTEICLNREKLTKTKAKKMARLASFLLNYTFIRKIAVRFIRELDIEKVKPDEADCYHMLFLGNYNPFGMGNTERFVTRRRIHRNLNLPPL